MLITRNLQFAYRNAEPLSFPDIECKNGEQWLILGQSGSGKTTLLNLLAGLRTPRSGSIFINDTEINRLSSTQMDHFRGRNIGIIFQQSHFVSSLTVQENLMLAQQLAKVKPNLDIIETKLAHLNVSHKLKDKPKNLSVGEQQRVAIARAIVNNPTIILADEPTSALDDENTEQVIKLLRTEASEANAILLIVTHDNRLKNVFEKQIQL